MSDKLLTMKLAVSCPKKDGDLVDVESNCDRGCENHKGNFKYKNVPKVRCSAKQEKENSMVAATD